MFWRDDVLDGLNSYFWFRSTETDESQETGFDELWILKLGIAFRFDYFLGLKKFMLK